MLRARIVNPARRGDGYALVLRRARYGARLCVPTFQRHFPRVPPLKGPRSGARLRALPTDQFATDSESCEEVQTVRKRLTFLVVPAALVVALTGVVLLSPASAVQSQRGQCQQD